MVFDRYLRPGDYRLILKVEDLATQKFFRTSISRQAGFEKWYWNNKELAPDQPTIAPGASLEVRFGTFDEPTREAVSHRVRVQRAR